MKRLIPYISLFSLALTTMLSADEAQQDKEPNIEVMASYINIDREKFSHTKSQRGHHLSYSEGYVLGAYKHALPSKTDLEFGLGYMDTRFSFSHDTKHTSFDQHHFHNLLAQFGATTKEVEKWEIDAGLSLQMNTDNFSLSRYTLFTGIVHGKHDFRENCHLHAGVLIFTGMQFTRVIPVIGFDYEFSKELKLNAVFPENMSLVYSINDHWSVDATVRYMFSRQRLNDHGSNPRGLVGYLNWGAEAGATYAFNDRCSINLHVGETLGGRMRLSDRHDNHRKHLRLDSSLYYGLEASVAF